MLRKVSKSGDDVFTDQWNEHVDTMRQFRKMRGGGSVSVTWVNGVPLVFGKSLGVEHMVAWAISDIAAASGDITSGGGLTPGSGDVQPCIWDGSVFKTNGLGTVTGYNLSSNSVAADTPLILIKLFDLWLIIFESC